jgi:type VI secretion system ImpM family protein
VTDEAAIGAFRAFGKHPSQADFVHWGSNSGALAIFDDWLTACVEWAHARGGEAFRAAFRAGGARAFLHRVDAAGDAATFVVGAIVPSNDQAGRLFPLTIAAPVQLGPDFKRAPELLPLICESIWQAAGDCAAELSQAPAADVGACVSLLPPAEQPNFADAARAYTAWGEQLPLLELWALIAPSQPLSGLGEALRLLIEAVRPHRAELPTTPLSLRVPLGAAGGAAVCFWLDVVRRLIGWQRTVPSFYWSHDGAEGQLTVHLGSAPPATISELWLTSETRDEFCSLTPPIGEIALRGLPELPPACQSALREPTSVAAFLAHLSA